MVQKLWLSSFLPCISNVFPRAVICTAILFLYHLPSDGQQLIGSAVGIYQFHPKIQRCAFQKKRSILDRVDVCLLFS